MGNQPANAQTSSRLRPRRTSADLLLSHLRKRTTVRRRRSRPHGHLPSPETPSPLRSLTGLGSGDTLCFLQIESLKSVLPIDYLFFRLAQKSDTTPISPPSPISGPSTPFGVGVGTSHTHTHHHQHQLHYPHGTSRSILQQLFLPTTSSEDVSLRSKHSQPRRRQRQGRTGTGTELDFGQLEREGSESDVDDDSEDSEEEEEEGEGEVGGDTHKRAKMKRRARVAKTIYLSQPLRADPNRASDLVPEPLKNLRRLGQVPRGTIAAMAASYRALSTTVAAEKSSTVSSDAEIPLSATTMTAFSVTCAVKWFGMTGEEHAARRSRLQIKEDFKEWKKRTHRRWNRLIATRNQFRFRALGVIDTRPQEEEDHELVEMDHEFAESDENGRYFEGIMKISLDVFEGKFVVQMSDTEGKTIFDFPIAGERLVSVEKAFIARKDLRLALLRKNSDVQKMRLKSRSLSTLTRKNAMRSRPPKPKPKPGALPGMADLPQLSVPKRPHTVRGGRSPFASAGSIDDEFLPKNQLPVGIREEDVTHVYVEFEDSHEMTCMLQHWHIASLLDNSKDKEKLSKAVKAINRFTKRGKKLANPEEAPPRGPNPKSRDSVPIGRRKASWSAEMESLTEEDEKRMEAHEMFLQPLPTIELFAEQHTVVPEFCLKHASEWNRDEFIEWLRHIFVQGRGRRGAWVYAAESSVLQQQPGVGGGGVAGRRIDTLADRLSMIPANSDKRRRRMFVDEEDVEDYDPKRRRSVFAKKTRRKFRKSLLTILVQLFDCRTPERDGFVSSWIQDLKDVLSMHPDEAARLRAQAKAEFASAESDFPQSRRRSRRKKKKDPILHGALDVLLTDRMVVERHSLLTAIDDLINNDFIFPYGKYCLLKNKKRAFMSSHDEPFDLAKANRMLEDEKRGLWSWTDLRDEMLFVLVFQKRPRVFQKFIQAELGRAHRMGVPMKTFFGDIAVVERLTGVDLSLFDFEVFCEREKLAVELHLERLQQTLLDVKKAAQLKMNTGPDGVKQQRDALRSRLEQIETQLEEAEDAGEPLDELEAEWERIDEEFQSLAPGSQSDSESPSSPMPTLQQESPEERIILDEIEEMERKSVIRESDPMFYLHKFRMDRQSAILRMLNAQIDRLGGENRYFRVPMKLSLSLLIAEPESISASIKFGSDLVRAIGVGGQYGLLHAYLTVKNLVLHWLSNSLVRVQTTDEKDEYAPLSVICIDTQAPIVCDKVILRNVIGRLAQYVVQSNALSTYDVKGFAFGELLGGRKGRLTNCQTFCDDLLAQLNAVPFGDHVMRCIQEIVQRVKQGRFEELRVFKYDDEFEKLFQSAFARLHQLRVATKFVDGSTRVHAPRANISSWRGKTTTGDVTVLVSERILVFHNHAEVDEFAKECVAVCEYFPMKFPGHWMLLKGYCRAFIRAGDQNDPCFFNERMAEGDRA